MGEPIKRNTRSNPPAKCQKERRRNCCEANIGYAYVNITEPVAGAHPEDAVSGSATGFSVKYGEDSFNIETNGECFRNVKDFFFQLAEKYVDNNK